MVLYSILIVICRDGDRFSIPEVVLPVPVEPSLCTLEDEAVLSCCYDSMQL